MAKRKDSEEPRYPGQDMLPNVDPDTRIRYKTPIKTDKMSLTAMKGKDKSKLEQAKMSALRKALERFIPAGPTR